VADDRPPAILYKYFPPERIDVLENRALRFTSPTGFNDTFDTHFLVPKCHSKQGVIERFRLKTNLGILCLTERPDDHLMWVHYAKNHTGFVLGFNSAAPFFAADGRTLSKVIYQDRPNVLPEPDVNACFHKSTVWSHEKEWRCVRSFQGSESRMAELPDNLITEIVFGAKMEPFHIAQIMMYVTAYEMTDIHFFRSVASHTSWTFENRPKKMAMCMHCEGNGYLMGDA
jgi:Protein of unknown function (DUF2971)